MTRPTHVKYKIVHLATSHGYKYTDKLEVTGVYMVPRDYPLLGGGGAWGGGDAYGEGGQVQ